MLDPGRDHRYADNNAPPSPSRRTLLIGTGAGLALSLLGLPPVAAQPADAATDHFLKLSRHLTGRPELDPVLGQRVLQALSAHYPDFPAAAQALARFVEDHSDLPVERLPAALKAQHPELAEVPRQIVSAWYLGQVGEVSPHPVEREGRSSKEPTPPEVEIVAYEHALMFDPVRDVVTIPSYCRDVPGYWARRPA